MTCALFRQKFIISLLISLSFNAFGQNSQQKYTSEFDQVVGEQNLGINNGVFNLQDYPYIIEGKTKYFLNKGYSKGNVAYDGQVYYGVNLKYDLYENYLIFNPKNASPNIGCNLIKEKVDWFELQNRKFINVEQLSFFKKNAAFQGYWQEIKIDKDFILFVNYSKNKREIIKDKKIYYQFDLQRLFLIFYQGRFQEVSSKSDVIKMFPTLSKEINRFYEAAQNNSDALLFNPSLLNHLNSLLDN